MTAEELKKLFSSERFLVEIGRVETSEDLQKLLKRYGLNVALNEINDVISINPDKPGKGDVEISEKGLDDISGGVNVPTWLDMLYEKLMKL